MLFKVVTVAVFAAVVSPIGAYAQSIAQIGGPSELPPASYKGMQYVDSRGCVFMRVESSGNAHWYPRVNGAHKPVCNLNRPKAVMDVAADVPKAAPKVMQAPVVIAQAAPVQVMRAPMETVASRMMPAAQPRQMAPVLAAPVLVAPVAIARQAAVASVGRAAVGGYETAPAAGPAKGQVGCYTSAPVAELVRLRNGGTVVMCTRGDGTTGGWRPPIYPAGSRPGIALRDPVQVSRSANNAGAVAAAADVAQVYASGEPDVVVPKGYRRAWKDGRLNTMRGVGTAAGQAAQDQIWTRKVPARLVADVAKPKRQSAKVTMSTMNAPTEAVTRAPVKGSGRIYVQVGTFGVAANASGAAARLHALGLPVAKSNLTKSGKALQIVMAGPFGSAAEAQSALGRARQAGFGDAFLR